MSTIKTANLKFWIFFLFAIIVGFIFPNQLKDFDFLILLILMIVLFIIFIKIDIFEILFHLKKPSLLLYVLIMNLVVFPIIVYFLSFGFSTDLIIALVLLASLPTGVSASALTDIIKGRTSLTLVISVLSTIIAIITMPLMFYLLLNTKIELNYISLILMLIKLIFVPLVISQIVKKIFNKRYLEPIQKYSNNITITLISIMIAIIIGGQANQILSNVAEVVYYLLILYVMFFIFQLVSYFMVYKLHKKDKIAVSNSKTFMNLSLGIGLAYLFFDPKIALIIVIAEIPWSTMLIIFSLYEKHLK